MGSLPKVITEDDIYREDQNDSLDPKEYEDPEKALANTLDQFGYPHIPELARRTGMDTEEVVGYFHLIQDPVLYDVHQDDNEDYLLSAAYLEGKHYYKLLKEAEKMNEKYPERFEANISLLQKHKPKISVLTVDDIYMGSRCISNYEYGVFIKNLFHLVFEPKVSYNRDTQRYSIEYRDEPSRELNNHCYGTPYKKAQAILLNFMNGDDNIVKTCTYNSNTGKIVYVKDNDQTIIVLEKVIIRAFRSFLSELLKDPKRADRVYERYSKLIGGFLPSGEERKGDWLTFPGLSRKTYPWQRAGVEDGLTHKALLFVWSIGSGKSLVLTALANELKRMGICSKILFVLPNGSITDFVKEACACYPDNHYLVIDNKKFSAKKKKYLDEKKRKTMMRL